MTDRTAYRVPPQHERKAVAELRAAGIKAYVPMIKRERRSGSHHKRTTITVREPIARGYVFSGGKHAFAKHVKERIGRVHHDELSRLYRAARQREPRDNPRPFQIGDTVKITAGPFEGAIAKLAKKRGHKMWEAATGGPRIVVHAANIERLTAPPKSD